MEPVFVLGAAVSNGWADASRSLQELIFDGVRSALASAGVEAAELGAVVLAAHDLVDGRGLTNMVTAPAAAAYLKDETRLADDGAAAFVLGDARVRSGSVEHCLVAAWGRASEGQGDRIAEALFDPFTARPLGLTEVAVSALRASSALATFPAYATARDAAGARRSAPPPGRRLRGAHPLRDAELPRLADLVAAVVLSRRPSPVEVLGVGMAMEPYDVGDRDLLAMPALRRASAQALAEARTEARDVDVFELDGITLFDEALAAEAVSAAPAGEGMTALASARVNADGGSSAGWCPPATGLVRVCRAYERLVRGSGGGGEQGDGRGQGARALATGASVVAAQSQTAIVLGRR